MALEFYEGETLRSRLTREGQLPVREAIAITRQIAGGLQAAHAAGIVHRDLKPANVMVLPNGSVRILDFGLAKARDHTLGTTSIRLGTAAYMAPEQIRGAADLDGRADLWALGVVLYEMLTGRKPFRGEEKLSIADAILREDPAHPSTYRHGLSTVLAGIVLRLLDKDLTRRYATAHDLLDDLVGPDPSRGSN
jgi:serine/threonine-protein kinase